MAAKQLEWNKLVAIFMTVACVILIGIAAYDALTGPVDWQRIMLYIAAIGFIASVAALFYMRWRENL